MKQKPLSYYIPQWICSSVSSLQCDKCNTSYSQNNIIEISIRDIDSSYILAAEVVCGKCEHHKKVAFHDSAKSTPEELCYIILEEVMRKQDLSKSQSLVKKDSKGGITDDEVSSLVDFMNETEDYNDLLKYIGYKTPFKKEENEKIVKPKHKKSKKNKKRDNRN